MPLRCWASSMAHLFDFGPVADFWAGDPQPLMDAIRRDGLRDTPGMREAVLHLLAGNEVPRPPDDPLFTRRLALLSSALMAVQHGMAGKPPALHTRREQMALVYRMVAQWEDPDSLNANTLDNIKRWATRNARAMHLIATHKRLVKRLPVGYRDRRAIKK